MTLHGSMKPWTAGVCNHFDIIQSRKITFRRLVVATRFSIGEKGCMYEQCQFVCIFIQLRVMQIAPTNLLAFADGGGHYAV